MMRWALTPYALVLFGTAVVAVVLALYVLRLRQVPGAKPLAALMLGAGIWAFADAAGLVSTDLATRTIWSKTSYFGTVLVPAAWLVFAVAYTGRSPLTRLEMGVLAVEPVVTLILVWTNELHRLVWSRVTVSATEPFLHLTREYGDWFWIHAAYSYLLLAIGAYLLLSMAAHLHRAYRRQSAVLLVAVAIPWAANLLYLLRFTPAPGLDLTPFGFLGAGVVVILGLYRFHVLEIFPGLLPIARDAVVEAMVDGVLVVDRQGQVIDLNPGAHRLLGSDDSAVGQPVDRLIAAWKELAPTLDEASVMTAELILGSGADERWCDLNVSPLRRGDGLVVGWLLVIRDVTERRQADRSLRERLEFEELVASISTQFVGLGAGELDEGINRALRGIGEAVGADRSYVFLLSSDGKTMSNTHEWCAEGISPQIGRLKNLPVDGFSWLIRRLNRFESLPIPSVAALPDEARPEREILQAQGIRSALLVPMVDARSLVGFLGFDAVRRERAWDEATVALLGVVGQVFVDALRRRQAEREREALAQAISHDLRAPLTVVLGQAQVLQRLASRPDLVEKSAEVIVSNARRMNSMIQDLVDSARLQADAVKLDLMPIDLGPIAAEVAEGLATASIEQPRRIEVEAPSSLPPVLADRDRVERILTNLLTNALRYSEPETVVTVSLVEGDGEIVTSVVDRGRGIPSDELPHLFERYYRGRAGRGERESLGLGLYITKGLVQAHRGRVWVESRVGEGSTFSFSLPIADGSAPQPGSADSAAAAADLAADAAADPPSPSEGGDLAES